MIVSSNLKQENILLMNRLKDKSGWIVSIYKNQLIFILSNPNLQIVSSNNKTRKFGVRKTHKSSL